MSDKTLLVLAASMYQLDTIKTAKQLGYRVVTTDNVPDNPGHTMADHSYSVDTTDMEGVLNIAIHEKVCGIISPCTEVAVPTMAYVAERLGLNGPPFTSTQITCDKNVFRRFLRENAFPVPEFYEVSEEFQPDEDLFMEKIWIIKPAQSSGSKGVFIINSWHDYQNRFPEMEVFSNTGVGILEEYVEGFQGTSEGILENGKIVFCVVLDRQTVSPPYVTTCGHRVPTLLGNERLQQLHKMLEVLFRLLQLTEGPFDCDFVATNDKIYILEISPRIGGNLIAPLLKIATGFDLVKYSVKKACDDWVVLPEKIKISPAATVLFGVSRHGNLMYNEEEAKLLEKESWVNQLSFDVKVNTPVLPFINSKYRIGEAIVVGGSREAIDGKIVEMKKRLGIRVEP